MFLVLTIRTAIAAKPSIQWLPLVPAVDKALETRRPLLIVQGPDSINPGRASRPFLESYTLAAWPDEVTRDFVSEHAIFHYRPMGKAVLVNAPRRHPNSEIRSNAVTYFCAPTRSGKIEVIDFIVGFPNPKLFQSKLQWAIDFLAKTRGLDGELRRSAAHGLHLQCLSKPLEVDDTPLDLKQLDEVITSSQEMRKKRVLHQFGENWKPEDHRRLWAALQRVAMLQDDTSHFVLAHYPLVSFAALESIAYRRLTGFSTVRGPLRTEWILRQRARQRPLLLIASRGTLRTPDETSFNQREWQPKQTKLLELLANFDSIELPRQEVRDLARDFNLTLLNEKRSNRWKFVVLYADHTRHLLVQDETRLGRVLRKALESNE